MMGKQDKQDSLFSYHVNLDRRIPDSHPLRQVKMSIDFSFVRGEVSHTYGHNGNESVDPEIIIKLMFLLFFDNISSERELMRQLPYRLDYLYFLDMGLDDDVPDHSVLSKARRRWGPVIFESFFVRTVVQCVESGLVDGSKLHFDGSLVEANASTDSVIKGSPELIKALKAAYRVEEKKLDGLDDDDESGDGDDSPGGGGYKPVNDKIMSTTDPDAPVVRRKGLPSRPRYKNHRAVDDLSGVVVATETTAGDVEENRLLMDLINQSESNTGISVKTSVADAQYGTADNFRECARRNVEAHMADLSQSHKNKGSKAGIYDESDFVYDGKSDSYTCPGGETLVKRKHRKKRKAFEYAAGPPVCNACARKKQCTRSDYGRTIKRHVDHELIEKARAQSHSRLAKADRSRRKHIAEGSFADAANRHGFKRSRWRGLWRQQIQDAMIAACQNVRKVISNDPRGPTVSGTQKIPSNRQVNNIYALNICRRFSWCSR